MAPMRDYLNDPTFPDVYLPASTPEAESMRSEPLQKLVAEFELRCLPIHSVVVVRRGRRILEQYGRDDGRQLGPADMHVLQSTTKTLCGVLVGLAISDGAIESVRTPAFSFFGAGEIEQLDSAKQTITIEHLLTMRSGLDYEEGTEADERVFAETCAARTFLSRSLVAEPGTRWNYSSGDSQILAEIVRRATGKTPLEYARVRLFEPLGIEQVRWDTDGGGTQLGGRGLFLRPRELARFGWLLACGGKFLERQLVPSAWIDESTQPRVLATSGWDIGSQYGYTCWIPAFGGFATQGYMGQNMYLFPDHQLVLVFNGALAPPEKANALLGGLVQELISHV